MKKLNKATPALLFRTPLWVQLPSDEEVQLLIKPLSYKHIQMLHEAMLAITAEDNFRLYYTDRDALAESIIDWRGAHGFTTSTDLVNQLPKSDVEYLFAQLNYLSMFNEQAQEKLEISLDIQFDDRFDEDWQCTKCKMRKGLQAARACPYLDEAERSKDFVINVNNRRYTSCPIFNIDMFYLAQASQAYKLYTLGMLPEEGGVGGQTAFFINAAQQYDRRVKQAERDAHEKLKRKSK